MDIAEVVLRHFSSHKSVSFIPQNVIVQTLKLILSCYLHLLHFIVSQCQRFSGVQHRFLTWSQNELPKMDLLRCTLLRIKWDLRRIFMSSWILKCSTLHWRAPPFLRVSVNRLAATLVVIFCPWRLNPLIHLNSPVKSDCVPRIDTKLSIMNNLRVVCYPRCIDELEVILLLWIVDIDFNAFFPCATQELGHFNLFAFVIPQDREGHANEDNAE